MLFGNALFIDEPINHGDEELIKIALTGLGTRTPHPSVMW